MKLLYIAPTIIDMEKPTGVGKKILAQVKSFAKEYEVALLYRTAQKVMLCREPDEQIEILRDGKSKYDILHGAFDVIRKEKINYCYIRYPYSDPYFLRLLRKMKAKEICTVIEIPTYPYDMEGQNTIKGRILQSVDAYFRRQLHKYIDRIITYSNDEGIFGVKTIKTINGIDFETVEMSSSVYYADTLHFCGVATIYQVNGYDRLIRGIKHYYENGGQRNIIFDIVGDGAAEVVRTYKELVKSLQLEDRVIFHGRLNGIDLDMIYSKAILGINSLAIHRQGLKNESTLKTREYAAKGLPILSSSYVDSLSLNDNKRYVCRISADETPVNVNDVIRFCDELYQGADNQRLKDNIRKCAQSICDMSVTLQPVIEFFNAKQK